MTESAVADPLRIDTRGLKCPWPVLRAARAMRGNQPFILLADDPVALTDIPALAEAQGWSVTVSQEETHFIFGLITND